MNIFQMGECIVKNDDLNIKKKSYRIIENYLFTINELQSSHIINSNSINDKLNTLIKTELNINTKIMNNLITSLSKKKIEKLIDIIIEDIYITIKNNDLNIEIIKFSDMFNEEEKQQLSAYFDFYKKINIRINNIFVSFLNRN